jgi:hypothetical protein
MVGTPRGVSASAMHDDLRVWDAATGETVGSPLVGHVGGVYALQWFPSGRLILSGGADASLRIWASGQCAAVFRGHAEGVLSVTCVGAFPATSCTAFFSCALSCARVDLIMLALSCVHRQVGASKLYPAHGMVSSNCGIAARKHVYRLLLANTLPPSVATNTALSTR